jgi:hypothetical protein
MQTARRLIVALSCAIVLWVFTSVAGALLDPAHAAFWSSSLMWSFLSTLLVAPALVMIFDTSLDRKAETPRRTAAAQETTPVAEGRSAPRRETSWPTPDRRRLSASQRSFVEDAAGAAYPIPEELGERQAAPENSRPDWTGTYAV